MPFPLTIGALDPGLHEIEFSFPDGTYITPVEVDSAHRRADARGP